MMDASVSDREVIDVDGRNENRSSSYSEGGPERLGVISGAGTARATPPSGAVRKGRRSGVAIRASAIVGLATGGVAFWFSPLNHYAVAIRHPAAPVSRVALNTLPGNTPTAPLAPAAKLAALPEPAATPKPPSQRPPQHVVVGSERGDDMAAFLKLGGHAPPPEPIIKTSANGGDGKPDATVAAAPGAAGDVIHGPSDQHQGTPNAPAAAASDAHKIATVAAKANMDVGNAPSPAATLEPHESNGGRAVASKDGPGSDSGDAKRGPALLPRAEVVVTPRPTDPLARVAILKAGPMTDEQQVQVLALVTQLGVLVRDQWNEIATLRTDQANLVKHVDGALTDFNRRVSLVEARGAVDAAMGASDRPAAAQPNPSPVVPVVAHAVTPASASADSVTHRYHVQAASPGLAMLSELDSAGGEERQIPASPGESLPGFGRVVSIAQSGTAWVVRTDHGVIR